MLKRLYLSAGFGTTQRPPVEHLAGVKEVFCPVTQAQMDGWIYVSKEMNKQPKRLRVPEFLVTFCSPFYLENIS